MCPHDVLLLAGSERLNGSGPSPLAAVQSADSATLPASPIYTVVAVNGKSTVLRRGQSFFFHLSALVRVAGSDRRCLANPCGFGEEGALRLDCLIFVSKLNPGQEEGGGLKWEPLSQILINVLSKKLMSIIFVSHSANEIAHLLAGSSNCYCSPGYIQGVVFAESLF